MGESIHWSLQVERALGLWKSASAFYIASRIKDTGCQYTYPQEWENIFKLEDCTLLAVFLHWSHKQHGSRIMTPWINGINSLEPTGEGNCGLAFE